MKRKSIDLLTYEELIKHYADKIRIEENGCWKWLGACSGNGYGQISVNGKMLSVLRVFYEKKFNVKLTDEQEGHHTCLNRWCGNPEHAEIKENRADHLSLHRKLSEEQIKEIVELHKQNKLFVTHIARRYNVSDVTILNLFKSLGLKSRGRRGVSNVERQQISRLNSQSTESRDSHVSST